MVSKHPQLPPAAPPDLGAVAVAIYLQVLRDGELRRDVAAEVAGVTLAEIDQSCNELLQNHLLSPDPIDPKRLVPNSPEIAAARLIEPMDELIRTYRTAAEATRERLFQLMPAFLARAEVGTGEHGRSLETVADAGDVQLLLMEEVQRASTDMMTVHPGGARLPAGLDEALPRDLAAIGRGVRLRVLYQHTARASLHTATYVAAISEAGGQVRTMEQLAERMLIFDRSTAFIPKWVHPDRIPGAVIVREPVLVAFLCSFFEQMWSTAAPYVPNAPGYREVSDELRRSVIRLLAQGFKDEVVARKLGMSVRTCRRHIASIMAELGAESRFEAGVKAAQLGLLDPTVD
jgi:DNA-binding CsgD family transcriptional regulator/sugar-specific transcriptional regulator TrmB